MGVKIAMDLYAYSQIKKYLEENGINIPRLRGLRFMKDQELVTEKDIEEETKVWLIWAVYPKAKSINDLHGKKRKKYKLALKHARKQYDIFNKYVGKNVLYVHTRIGGITWDLLGMDEITKHPLYLERVDDYLDSTYCDIYFKLKEN
jgi:hypothetical protein